MKLNISNWRPPEIASPDVMTQYPVDARGADWRNKDIGTLEPSNDKIPREKAISVADGIAHPFIVS